MASAKTIRKCSQVILVVNIIASVAIGGIIADLSGKSTTMRVLACVVIVVGIFIAVMLNALFIGFADIIDNTYATANKGNDVTEVQKEIKSSLMQPNKCTSQDKPLPNVSNIWKCCMCGEKNSYTDSFCKRCGTHRR